MKSASEEDSQGGEVLPFRPAATRTVYGLQPLASGSRLAGRYRVLDLLGAGGMGLVYQAYDEQLDLMVALKVLRPELAQEKSLIERFRRELVLARQVTHRNAVRIHDIGQDGDLLFLTMDFVPGCSLRDLLAKEGPLAPERAADIVRQLAAALEAAHQEGVVHRDLKPANVLVDETGRASITDFGVARSLHQPGLTRTGMVMGTLDYLSPEQARGGEVDGRSDLYSLGILFYEMLTGELPFAGGSAAEVLAQRITAHPRDLRRSGITVPEPLRAIVRRLLARDPAQRFQSARELLDALDRPQSTRRRPAFRLVAATLGLLTLAVLGWFALGRPWPASSPAAAPEAPKAPEVPAAGRLHTVAVLPLADETGRPDLAWISAGLSEMLATALAENAELQVVDSARVFRTLEDLKLPQGPLPEPDLRRLAQLLATDRLIAGKVRASGGRLRVDLELISTNLPSLPAVPLHAEEANTEAVFRLAEELGAAVRERLRVASPKAGPGLATTSPAALRAYTEGVERLQRGDGLAAVPALEQAVASDPRFTAAWVRLARARDDLGRREAALAAAQQAVATLREGESRGAGQARAVAALLAGEPGKSQQILERLLAQYPNDVETRVQLAEAYGEQGSLGKAVTALERVVRLDPQHPRAWFLLAKYSILSGNARRAVDEYLVHALVIQNKLGQRAGPGGGVECARRSPGATSATRPGRRRTTRRRRRSGAASATTAAMPRRCATWRPFTPSVASTPRPRRSCGRPWPSWSAWVTVPESPASRRIRPARRRAGPLPGGARALPAGARPRRDQGDEQALAQSFNNVGFAYYLLGQFDNAMVYLRQGLDLYRKGDDPSGVVLGTQSVALLQLAQGDWDEATESFLTTLRASRGAGMKEAEAVSLGNLGRLAQYQGRFRAALDSYGEALAVLRELGYPRGLAEFTLAQAEAELEIGKTGSAGTRLAAAEKFLVDGENREQQAELLRLQGRVAPPRGEPAAAAEAVRRAMAAARASHSIVELLQAAAERGGGGPRARPASAGALAALAPLERGADALGHALLQLRAAETLAQAALAVGDPGEAAGGGARGPRARCPLAARPPGPTGCTGSWRSPWSAEAGRRGGSRGGAERSAPGGGRPDQPRTWHRGAAALRPHHGGRRDDRAPSPSAPAPAEPPGAGASRRIRRASRCTRSPSACARSRGERAPVPAADRATSAVSAASPRRSGRCRKTSGGGWPASCTTASGRR